jgi:Lrp/AsnC family transcriptional regulator, leucine-responsive regulatory protein
MTKFKLDLTDRKILTELDKNCRVPNSVLAKRVNKSRETVNYRIQQLQKKGIIQGFITSINPNKFGYEMYKVYLKIENIPKEREKFISELEKKDKIYWIGVSEGAFDLVFAILAKDQVEYYESLNSILSKWKHLVINKVLGTMVDTRQYNKKFFIESKKNQTIIFGGKTKDCKLDKIDKDILYILSNDARIHITSLAKKTDSTVDIVRSRIKKLEKEKIILQYRLAIDFNKLGLTFFKAIIYFRFISPKQEKKLMQWMQEHPKSLYYIRSLAPWEVEFEFVVENYQEFNKIINDLRGEFPEVIKNHEHLIMISETWMPAYRALFKE